MKNIILFISVIAILFISACKKDNPTPNQPPTIHEEPEPEDTITLQPFVFGPGDTTHGFAQGIWQDSFLWEASCAVYGPSPDPDEPQGFIAISVRTYETNFGFIRQSIGLTEIPINETGIYQIVDEVQEGSSGFVEGGMYKLGDDGDVLENVYLIDETATDNELTITEVDTVENTYRGKFTISLERVWGTGSTYSPDFITIKDVVFWAKIAE